LRANIPSPCIHSYYPLPSPSLLSESTGFSVWSFLPFTLPLKQALLRATVSYAVPPLTFLCLLLVQSDLPFLPDTLPSKSARLRANIIYILLLTPIGLLKVTVASSFTLHPYISFSVILFVFYPEEGRRSFLGEDAKNVPDSMVSHPGNNNIHKELYLLEKSINFSAEYISSIFRNEN
jgi:hypothetical protein